MRPHLSRLRERLRDDSGQSIVGMVTLFPLFIVIVFGFVQASMFYHAQTVAHSAAAAAYQASRTIGGTSQAGQGAAQKVMGRHSDVLLGGGVEVSRSANQVTVTVTGQAPRLVPLWPAPQIEQRVSGPAERVLP